MSDKILNRLPPVVRLIFQAYRAESLRSSKTPNPIVDSFLKKSSPHYQTFNRQKLVQPNVGSSRFNFNPLDFSPVEAQMVTSVFDGPLDLEKEAEQKLQFLLDRKYGKLPSIPNSETTLISDRENCIKSLSLYHARIQSNFASYYMPLLAPYSYVKSLTWYRRLLSNTPVIFFLKQKQRLFSEPSLSQYNFPLHTLRDNLRRIKKRYHRDETLGKRTRSYYLSDLITTDIFSLAVNSEHLVNIPENECNSPSFWSSSDDSDKLVAHILDLQKPRILSIRPQDELAGQSSFEEIDLGATSIETVTNNLQECRKNSSKFPYDIEFTDLYILSIENSVLKDDHSQLLDMLESMEDIEVTAVRVDRVKAATSAVSSGSASNSKNPQTYEKLLNMISTDRQDSVSSVFQRLGEWGLVDVEENQQGSALYLFKNR